MIKSQIREVNQVCVDVNPFVGLVADCDGVPLFFTEPWHQLFSLAIDSVEAESLELLVVEAVDLVNFLQADKTCRTGSDFFDNSRPSEREVEYLW